MLLPLLLTTTRHLLHPQQFGEPLEVPSGVRWHLHERLQVPLGVLMFLRQAVNLRYLLFRPRDHELPLEHLLPSVVVTLLKNRRVSLHGVLSPFLNTW